MDKLEKCLFIGLFLLAGVFTVLLAAGHGKLFSGKQEQLEPFIPERVVTVRLVMAEKDWQWLLSNARNEQYVRADFWYDGYRYPNAGVRAKGNSSLMSVAGSGSPRLSLKVDFNFFNSALSFRGLKKVCLNNGFSDPTFVREVLAYEVFEQMGFPTPRTAFVDLYVNTTHLGLYTQVEPIDKNFLSRHFDNPNGNLYKPEIGAATLNWTEKDLKQRDENTSRPGPQRQEQKNLAINIGGSRLGDLLNLLEREKNGTAGTAAVNAGFPGWPFGGGPPPEGFDPQRMPPPGMGGGFGPPPFAADGNEPFVPFGGPMPPQQEGFAPGRRDPNGFRPEFGPPPMGPDGRPFDPNQFRPGRGQGRRGFGWGPGGPGGMPGFGRGGNLLESMGLKTNENYQNHTTLLRFLDVLNNSPDDTFAREIEKVLNVDQVLRYLAVSSMLVHLDNYTGMGHNYYLYEESPGYFTLLPWDLNMAFGTFRMGASQGDVADFYIDEPVTNGMDSRPLVKRLLAHPPYMERYHQYHEDLLAGAFAEGVMEKRIDAWVALIRPYVEKDENKFFTMEQFEKGLTEGSSGMFGNMGPGRFGAKDRPQMNTNRRRMGGPGGGPGGGLGMGAPGLKSFIAKRRVSVRKQLDGQLPSKPTAEERQRNNPWPGMFGPGGMP